MLEALADTTALRQYHFFGIDDRLKKAAEDGGLVDLDSEEKEFLDDSDEGEVALLNAWE